MSIFLLALVLHTSILFLSRLRFLAGLILSDRNMGELLEQLNML